MRVGAWLPPIKSLDRRPRRPSPLSTLRARVHALHAHHPFRGSRGGGGAHTARTIATPRRTCPRSQIEALGSTTSMKASIPPPLRLQSWPDHPL